MEYSFHVIADPDGGYVIEFPDLPGCLTQVDTLDEIPAMADEARTLWIESVYERGLEVPLPRHPEEYSGKFNVRLTRSLHRSLAEAAADSGVSLNQYVATVLARGDVQARLESHVATLADRIDQLERSQATSTRELRRSRIVKFPRGLGSKAPEGTHRKHDVQLVAV
jgi:antitoxin HicB